MSNPYEGTGNLHDSESSLTLYNNSILKLLKKHMDLDLNLKKKTICDFGAGVGAFATLFESTFWGQVSGGSIWGGNSGQLNLANSFDLLSKKDSDLSRVLYVPIIVNLPPELSIKIASNYCKAGKAITIPANLLPPVPKHSDMYVNHLQYYVDPNLDVIEINPS